MFLTPPFIGKLGPSVNPHETFMKKSQFARFLFFGLLLATPLVWAGFEEDLAATRVPAAAPSALRARAEAGDANAQLNMGGMYFTGKGVTQDYAESARWFLLAARQGHAQAQFNLGMMYATGQGVTLDNTEATKWYRAAALQKLAVAQLNLGVAYATGQGVTQNPPEAARWIRLAAEQGNAQAEFNLGVIYANGTGVTRDLMEAYHWAKLAAIQGHPIAPDLVKDLSHYMTSGQLAEAEGAADSVPVAVNAADHPVATTNTPAPVPVNSTTPAPEPVAVAENVTAPSHQETAAPVAMTDQAGPENGTVPPAETGKFYLQLAAFKSQEEALSFFAKMRVKLAKSGMPLLVYSQNDWVRVQSGPYNSQADAVHNADVLKEQLGYAPILKQH